MEPKSGTERLGFETSQKFTTNQVEITRTFDQTTAGNKEDIPEPKVNLVTFLDASAFFSIASPSCVSNLLSAIVIPIKIGLLHKDRQQFVLHFV